MHLPRCGTLLAPRVPGPVASFRSRLRARWPTDALRETHFLGRTAARLAVVSSRLGRALLFPRSKGDAIATDKDFITNTKRRADLDARAVESRSGCALQVFDPWDAVDELERRVAPRNLLVLDADVRARVTTDDDRRSPKRYLTDVPVRCLDDDRDGVEA